MSLDKWDMRFLDVAKLVSTWSKDPSTQTGAVIAEGRRIVSVGFNGLPQGVLDLPERYNNRELKYKLIVHCERNALIFAQCSVKGHTLYTHPFMSCSTCASIMIQAGIKRVVAPYSENERWVEDFKESSKMFKEAGVKIDLLGGPRGGYLRRKRK